jgi:lauroyl/myristoyl acyltransferase
MPNDTPQKADRPRLAIESIPFEETYPDEPPAPPPVDLFSRDPERTDAARRYWLRHPVEGTINRIFHELLRLAPCEVTSGIGAALSPFAYWRYKDRKFARRIAQNLETLAPDLCETQEQHEASLKSWWRNIGRTLSEFSSVNRLWPEGRIIIEGHENIEAARASGAPLIFVSMHLATWEAIFAAVQQELAPPNIGPFQPEPNRFTNRIVYNSRKRRNHYLFPPGQRSAYRLHRLLTGGGAASMTIFIDEVRDNQIHLPLFGREPPDKGNAVVAIKLANASGGTLVPLYLSRDKGARFRLHILPPIPKRPAPETPYPVPDTILKLNGIFEPLVLKNIREWYMLAELRLPKRKKS